MICRTGAEESTAYRTDKHSSLADTESLRNLCAGRGIYFACCSSIHRFAPLELALSGLPLVALLAGLSLENLRTCQMFEALLLESCLLCLLLARSAEPRLSVGISLYDKYIRSLARVL